MQLFYSGADQPDAVQGEACKSLGGYISTSPVPNARLSNLFSNIAKSTVLKGVGDIRLIVLKNTTGAIANGITIYTNVTGSHIKLKIAAVAPATDSSGFPVFESVMDGSSLPYQATLDYHEGSGNAIAIATLAAGGYIGVWLSREIDQSTFPALNASPTMSPQDLAALITAQATQEDESIQLIYSYS